MGRARDDVRGKGTAPSGSSPPDEPPTFPDPIPASALKLGDPNGDWFWHGFLARHSTTLLSSLWKAGKTTLFAHLLRTFGGGGLFCGRTVKPARVLVVTEEPESMWAKRRDKIGFADHVHFQIRPFRMRPSMAAWVSLLEHLRRRVDADGFDLVAFDPLTTLWPVEKENEAGPVAEALMPLSHLTDKAAVLLSHHFRKSDGTEATGARGSGALPGYVDTIMELRRFNPGDRKDRRRVISAWGRFEETPDELVVQLTPDGGTYSAEGDRDEVRARDLSAVVRDLLPAEDPGWTWEEVRAALERALGEGESVPGKIRLCSVLQHGAATGLWHQSGTGVKGNPYRYRRVRATDSDSDSALYRAESESESVGGGEIPD